MRSAAPAEDARAVALPVTESLMKGLRRAFLAATPGLDRAEVIGPLVGIAPIVVALWATGAPDARIGATCTPASTSPPPVPAVLRPTTRGPGGYGMAEAAPYVTASAAVHYVTSGPDAPPLPDSDGDGVPDYVEVAGEAADRALAFFAAPSFRGEPFPGFAAPLCDRAGPDERPDIYIKDIGPFGVAHQPTRAEGGPFVLVDNRLENADVSGGVAFTVAHELFHLVQFVYVPSGMPQWIAEGTANTLAFFFEGVDHAVLLAQVDSWYRTTDYSLYDESLHDPRGYGGLFWWGTAARPILRHFFEELRQSYVTNGSVGRGTDQLAKALEDLYIARDLGPVARDALFYEFESMSEGVFFVLAPKRPPFRSSLRLRERGSTSVARDLRGLSTHYVRVTVPRRAKALRLRVSTTMGAQPHVGLLLGVKANRCARRLEPRFFGRSDGSVGRGNTIATTLGTNETSSIVLVISSGGIESAMYRVEAEALRRRTAPVGAARPCGVPPVAASP
jgi:hypothetical protein